MKHKDYVGKFVTLLPMNRWVYRFCYHYVNRYNNDKNAYMWKNGASRWLEEVLGACQLIVDVGANTGDWTATALKINPNLYVHCFEPSSTIFARLKSRLAANERVVTNNLALGATIGEIELYLFSQTHHFSSIYRRSGLVNPQTQVEKVYMDTLDSYCSQNSIEQIDLLKLDVEGNEYAVLQGAQRLLGQGAIKRIQFEYADTYIDARVLLKDMFELLTNYDYKLYKVYRDRIQWVSRYHYSLETFYYQNWVALL